MNQKGTNKDQNEDKQRQDGGRKMPENPVDNITEKQTDLPSGKAGITSHTEAEKNPATELEEVLASTKDKLLRLYSEFDNFKKRTTREKMEFAKIASADTVLALLPVLDDFERAIKSMSETKESA